MSVVANSSNNARAENFMETWKSEEIYNSGCEIFAKVTARLARFIDDIYSAKHIYSVLGHGSPNHFETQLARRMA